MFKIHVSPCLENPQNLKWKIREISLLKVELELPRFRPLRWSMEWHRLHFQVINGQCLHGRVIDEHCLHRWWIKWKIVYISNSFPQFVSSRILFWPFYTAFRPSRVAFRHFSIPDILLTPWFFIGIPVLSI